MFFYSFTVTLGMWGTQEDIYESAIGPFTNSVALFITSVILTTVQNGRAQSQHVAVIFHLFICFHTVAFHAALARQLARKIVRNTSRPSFFHEGYRSNRFTSSGSTQTDESDSEPNVTNKIGLQLNWSLIMQTLLFIFLIFSTANTSSLPPCDTLSFVIMHRNLPVSPWTITLFAVFPLVPSVLLHIFVGRRIHSSTLGRFILWAIWWISLGIFISIIEEMVHKHSVAVEGGDGTEWSLGQVCFLDVFSRWRHQLI